MEVVTDPDPQVDVGPPHQAVGDGHLIVVVEGPAHPMVDGGQGHGHQIADEGLLIGADHVPQIVAEDPEPQIVGDGHAHQIAGDDHGPRIAGGDPGLQIVGGVHGPPKAGDDQEPQKDVVVGLQIGTDQCHRSQG